MLRGPDLQHQVWVLPLSNRLYSVPLPSNVWSVLDIDCGNMNWALALAEERPTTEGIAADLPQDSAIQSLTCLSKNTANQLPNATVCGS